MFPLYIKHNKCFVGKNGQGMGTRYNVTPYCRAAEMGSEDLSLCAASGVEGVRGGLCCQAAG